MWKYWNLKKKKTQAHACMQSFEVIEIEDVLEAYSQ